MKTTEHRPWGGFTILDEGDGYKVKRLSVNVGQSTSLQYHKFRSERWTVVQGVARVILSEKEYILDINQSIHIPVGQRHMLINHGDILMQLIEVQIGDYLGEDDIVRIEDKYGRV